MKPTRTMPRWRSALTVSTFVLGLSNTALVAQSSDTASNPYDEVVSRLEPGGDFLLYWNASKALETLDETLTGLLDSLPEFIDDSAVTFAKQAYRSIGLSHLTAVGMSSRQAEDGIYRNLAVIYHEATDPDGLIWNAFGMESRELWWARQLPATTALAMFSDVHWTDIAEAIGRLIAESGVEEIQEEVEEGLSEIADAIDLERFAGSLDSGIGVALTLNPEIQVTLPIEETGQSLEVPEPGLILSFRVRDDYILNQIHGVFDQEDVPISDSEIEGVAVKTLAFPLPLPFRVNPSLFEADGIVYLVSNLDVAERVLKARRDPDLAIGSTGGFQEIAGDWDFRASEFVYLSPSVGDLVAKVQNLILSQAEMGPEEKAIFNILSKNWGGEIVGPGVFVTLKRTQDGYTIENRSATAGGPAVLAQVGIAQAGVAAAVVLPAVAKAKESAQRAQSMNQMKQLAIAAYIYSDAQDEPAFPERIEELFEYVGDPSVFVCPSDDSVEVAPDWESFDEDKHSSYVLLTNVDWDEPLSEQPLIRCKVNDLVAYADGSVRSE